jgi:lipopolysaccharide export system permease protein
MILHLYFARRTLMSLLTVSAIFAVLTLLIEFIEQIRIFGSADLSMLTLFYISMLRVPVTLHTILPIIMVISTLVLLLGLSRSSELVVTRAAGRSALRALQSPLVVAFLFGVMGVSILNPLVSLAGNQYETLKVQYVNAASQSFSVSREGLWLRQGNADGQVVIRAGGANSDGSVLYDVTFLGFLVDGSPEFRIEAQSAALQPEFWHLTMAKRWSFQGTLNPEATAQSFDGFDLETSLTLDEIKDTLGDPSAVPIWKLPEFIENLERSGFSARAYKMWLQMELSLPLTMMAMMLIGASFTMRHTRFGRTSSLVLTALLVAFLFFFLRSFTAILGENGQIPIYLAAWAPPVAAILLPLAFLLHLEDG